MTGRSERASQPVEFPPIEIDYSLSFEFDAPRRGYEYWAAKAAGRPMPDRREIDPVQLVPILKNLSLFDMQIVDNRLQDLRARLVGLEFERVFGSLRNRELITVLGPAVMTRWCDLAACLLEHGGPIRATGQVVYANKGHLGFELLLAPLTNGQDGAQTIFLVDHIYSRVKNMRAALGVNTP